MSDKIKNFNIQYHNSKLFKMKLRLRLAGIICVICSILTIAYMKRYTIMRHIYDMNDRIILGLFVAALIVLTIFCIYVAALLLSSYVDYYESISLKCCVLLDRIDGELCEMIDNNSNICDKDGNISSEYEELIIEIINNNIPDILVGEPKTYIYDFKIVARKVIIDYIKCR